MCSRNSGESPWSAWISSSDCSQRWVRVCTSFSAVSADLYIQCEATPDSASRFMSVVRICTSIGVPLGPNRMECSDW